jgi:hypothetical protein
MTPYELEMAADRRRKLSRNALYVVTALAFAFVRNLLQYGRHTWDSVTEFAITWFIHYLALLVAGGIFYVVLVSVGKRFADDKEVSVDTAMLHFCLAVLVLCALAFIVRYWPSSGELE